ncbi:MAG: lysophospholipid acyltransferase family protein [Planctomycetia bacterium]|nr:lysophospholipid acyltransferase family protein [Planctomycetia bacterium]
MRINSPLLQKTIGLLGAMAVARWMRTLDYRAAYYDPTVDPVNPDCGRQMIYVFWHEYMLLPVHMRGHCNLAMLLSRHRDAELLARVARHLGFDFIRGSTNRGSISALREMVRRSGKMNLAITPDGPRGPRRVMAAGAIYVASRLQMPIVTMGMGVDRPWRLRSWDRFAIPRPFSRARGVIGPPIVLPPDLDRDGVEHYRAKVDEMLNRLTREAEVWAASGSRKAEEQIVRREPARHLHLKADTQTKAA